MSAAALVPHSSAWLKRREQSSEVASRSRQRGDSLDAEQSGGGSGGGSGWGGGLVGHAAGYSRAAATLFLFFVCCCVFLSHARIPGTPAPTLPVAPLPGRCAPPSLDGAELPPGCLEVRQACLDQQEVVLMGDEYVPDVLHPR